MYIIIKPKQKLPALRSLLTYCFNEFGVRPDLSDAMFLLERIQAKQEYHARHKNLEDQNAEDFITKNGHPDDCVQVSK